MGDLVDAGCDAERRQETAEAGGAGLCGDGRFAGTPSAPGLPDLSRPLRSPADVGRMFESLVVASSEPYQARAARAQKGVDALLDRLGRPERRLRIVHIAGSKGKGSTALLVEAIFGAGGLRVGTFTSPHLQRWSERFRLAGREVGDEAFVAAAEIVRTEAAAMMRARRDFVPGFFDLATAIAFVLFERAGVDVAVVETGIGGRLDATNVAMPAVSCITSIELEHTDKLGDTLQAIAGEKAGIIKPGVPVVVGELPGPALDVVLARAAELGAPVRLAGRDFGIAVTRSTGAGLALRLAAGELALDAALPVLGAHLADNAAMALACVHASALLPAHSLAGAAIRGLASASLPGRTEVLRRRPWVIADGAHTVVSASALMKTLRGLGCADRHMVLSLSSAHKLHAVLPILLSGARSVTFTRADPARSLAPEIVAASATACFPALPVKIVADPRRAVIDTLAGLGPDDLMCVTGSVYAAGAARDALAAGVATGRGLLPA